MSVSIKAPVGDTKRITKGKPAKNAKSDVELVQLMLCANGRTVAIDGKCSGGLINAIKSFQKSKLGYKKPDGVVDPGGKTWNAGVPKLTAQIAADKAACEDMVILMVNGKEKRISKALYKKNQQELRQKVISKAQMMYGQADSWAKFCMDAERMASGADRLALAAVSFLVAKVNKKANPPHDVVTHARGEAMALKAMASNPSTAWTKIQAQDAKATKAYNNGVVAFKAFIDARIGTASSFVGKLEQVRDISFKVVEAYATARLVVAGNDPVKARRMAAAGTTAMKSGATELGEYLAGNEVSFGSSAKKVIVDSAIAGAKASIGGKASGSVKKEIAKKLGAYFAVKVSKKIGKDVLNTFAEKLTDSKNLEGLLGKATEEAIDLFKPMLDGGKAPGKKEFEEAVMRTLGDKFSNAGPVTVIEAFDAALPDRVRETVAEKLAPVVQNDVLQMLVREYGDDVVARLPASVRQKMSSDAAQKVLDMATDIYTRAAADASGADPSEAQLHKAGDAGVQSHGGVKAQLEKLLREAAEKELKSLTAAAAA